MKIRFLTAGRPWVGKLVAAACVAVSLPFTTPARAATQMLSGHVPAAVARLQPVENLAGSQRLNLAIGLPLRNREALTNLLQQIYDPASTNYHHYLTPEQFTKMFGPTEQDYQAVVAFAKANGFTVTGRHPNRMLLDVNGAATDVEKAFQVRMKVYQHPTENRTFYAPDVEPSVPAGLPILDISGLNNYGRPYPKYKLKPANLATNATPNVGSGPGGNYMGNDFRKAYAPDVKFTGAGQTIALVQFDGYLASDIIAYETMAGLPNVTLQTIQFDEFDGQPTGNGGEVEVSLDIEMVISMAPGLSKVYVYEGNPDPNFFNPNNVLNSIANDNAASQISCSWGWTGGPDATTSQHFQQMAAQGQSFFNASGDSDAFLPGQVDDPGYPGSPSSSPYITQVGGTTLTTSGPGGSWVSETVWNWGGGIGSSGGISSFYQIPIWQRGINMSVNGGSTTFRNIPDVAMTADNVFVIADGGIRYRGMGGTSCASPLWAGFMALVNQQAATLGLPPVGFINPAIYAIGKRRNYTSDFHDTIVGNNTWSGSPTEFYAVSGYDLCTGWGTPNGQNLIDALTLSCAPDGILEVNITPANGSTLLKGTNQTIYVQVTDALAVTNATVIATIIGSTNLVFKNNGVAPDATANDDIYTANLVVPNNTNNLTLSFLITATNTVYKMSSTNVVIYNVAPIPANDNFTNAIKVPDAGAVYLSNNKFATIESGEPDHDADASVGASLWWNWTPTGNTNVLIDTTGSAIDIVLAVYTGNTLTNLQQVIATNNAGSGTSAYLRFNVVSNTTYQIAVASANSSSVGSLRFRVAPGGQPDTNAPVVFITSPLSGFGATNFLITVSGTANDPQPNASGISQVFINLNDQCTFAAAGTTNWSSTFGVKPGLNNISAFAEDVAGNISAPVGIQVIYIVQVPPNDFFANAIALINNPGWVSATNTGATKEPGEPNHAGNAGGKSVWWSFSTNVDGVLTLSTTNSTFDTLLGLYSGPDVAHLTTIAGNDDAYVGARGGFSLINQAVKAGTYYIAVDGFDGASGTVVLSNSFVPANLCHLTTYGNGVGGMVQVTAVNSRGGIAVMPGTSGDFASNSTVVLTAFPNLYYTFNAWSGSVTSSANPLSFVITSNMTITGSFSSVAFSDDFETGDLSRLPWITGINGTPRWYVQTNVVAAGQYAARSGVITDSQSSYLILIGNFGTGTGSFDYLVSSEEHWDIFSFYVDDVLQQQWSGEVGWANFAFPLTAGQHTLEWSYVKDSSFSSGLDAAFIDNVNLPSFVPQPLQFGSVVQSDGTFRLTITSPASSTIIQASTNLVNWMPVYTNYTFSFTFTDSTASSYPYRFYRAVSGP
ncbi:MAG: protease pro-enzyme activation domain-containing protein [Verrucomicrobiota bacterium]